MRKPNKKLLIIIIGIVVVFLIVGIFSIYYLNFYEEDPNKDLPKTMTMEETDEDLETIAYRFWFDYLQSYQTSDTSSWNRISEVGYNKFQLLAGDEEEFAMAVTFQAKLERGKWSTHHSWGDVQEDGMVEGIQWTLRIRKDGEKKYTLERIETTTGAVAGLAPVTDTYQKEAGIEVSDVTNRYEIANDTLKITFDNGKNWREVPIAVEDLFRGAYSGSKKYLIDGSYVLTPEKTAFVVGGNKDLRVLLSTDEGKTWQESVVQNEIWGIRMRLLGFTSDQDGYLIITADKTMSFEANFIYKTSDGGKTWEKVGSVQGTNRLVTDGGFVNDKLGFMSFGFISANGAPPEPVLYRTEDGGENWEEVDILIPAEYKGIFTMAEVPTFDGSQGILLVNQGPNGDYQGGNVLARYISIDEGKTWSFANLVDPDNVLDH